MASSASNRGLYLMWRQAQRHLFAHELDQHHDALLAIAHLKNALDASKRTLRDHHLLSNFKELLRPGFEVALVLTQRLDQGVVHLGRLHAKAHQAAYPERQITAICNFPAGTGAAPS